MLPQPPLGDPHAHPPPPRGYGTVGDRLQPSQDPQAVAPRGDGAFPPPPFLGSGPGERERSTEEQPQGTQEAAGSHRPSSGARARPVGTGLTCLASPAWLSLLPTLLHFGTGPLPGSQPRLLPSLRTGHTLLFSTFFCPLPLEPLPNCSSLLFSQEP